jgi:hypothetical protein
MLAVVSSPTVVGPEGGVHFIFLSYSRSFSFLLKSALHWISGHQVMSPVLLILLTYIILRSFPCPFVFLSYHKNPLPVLILSNFKACVRLSLHSSILSVPHLSLFLQSCPSPFITHMVVWGPVVIHSCMTSMTTIHASQSLASSPLPSS